MLILGVDPHIDIFITQLSYLWLDIQIMFGLLHLLELDVQRLIDCGHVPHHHHRDRGHLL